MVIAESVLYRFSIRANLQIMCYISEEQAQEEAYTNENYQSVYWRFSHIDNQFKNVRFVHKLIKYAQAIP
jgi:hypothetical protein